MQGKLTRSHTSTADSVNIKTLWPTIHILQYCTLICDQPFNFR